VSDPTGPDERAGDPMIRVASLDVSLGGERVLEGVDAAVPRGSFVGLVGPNGAGKTTLLKAVTGAVTPDAGRVELDGDPVADLSSRETSRRVATVPQNPSLSFEFDVREVVEMGRTPHLGRFERVGDDDRRTVQQAMERTAVTEFADRPVGEVSGGERSRVLLARALAQATPALALDEPTASLDINHQLRTLSLVRELVDDGKTAVAAIHDLDLAARFCDRLVVLAGGRVLAHGPPEEVLLETTVRDAFDTTAAVARAPETGSRRVTALGSADGEGDGEEGSGGRSGRVHVFGGGGRATRYMHALAAAGYDLSLGPVHEGDADAETARRLGVDAVTAPPLSRVDRHGRAAVRERLREADAVLVADATLSDGNVECFEAALSGPPVVLVAERPLADRNHAGAAGRRCYEGLRERGRTVEPEEVLDAVAGAVAAGSRSAFATGPSA
jgi:iron complex transport system ATP-binding protein